MDQQRADRKYVPLRSLAAILNLPVTWLKAEADAGRIPCIRAGRRRLFNLEAVEGSLARRAGEFTPAPGGQGTEVRP